VKLLCTYSTTFVNRHPLWHRIPFSTERRQHSVGGTTGAELVRARRRLEGFTAGLFEEFTRCDQRARGACYVRGLLLEGRRKSIEPMAARLPDTNKQALHHFIHASPWDWRPVRRRLAERVCRVIGPAVWVVDDTGFPKDGRHSVGVQRQYSGTLGKVANCQLGVSVHATSEQASCPLDRRLFVPQSWDDDTAATVERRRAAHLPTDVHHRPKWQLVLDMLDELAGWELHPPVLVADAGYGDTGAFRQGLAGRGVGYIVQVKAATSATPERHQPPVVVAGRQHTPHVTPGERASLHALVTTAGEQAAVPIIWREGSRGRQRSRFVALRVRAPGLEQGGWLLAEWPPDQAAPSDYWLSNLPERTPMVALVRLGKLRWRIEHDYRELKDALGLDHYQVRSWPGWHHHVTLVSAAHAFVTLQRLDPKARASA
jgi:SRSO17 transposase